MFEITVAPGSLSSAQRKLVANLIVNWPDEDSELTVIPAFTTADEQPSPEPLPEPSPEQAFSGPVLVPSPPAPPAATGVTLDKAGLPWNERIHTSSHATNADGTWRRKRGVDDALVAQVEAELRAVMAIPAPAPPPPPPAPTEPTGSGVIAPPPPAPIPPASVKFIDVVSRASDLVAVKKLTMEQINTVIASFDSALTLPLLANRADLLPQVLDAINAAAA